MPDLPPERKRVAVVTELEWPLRRHYELVGGAEEYANENEDWDIDVTRFPQVQLESGVHFDGLVGRIEPAIHEAAKKAGIPVVNVLISSRVASELPNVFVDAYAGGRMAAEHLIHRGMPRLASLQFSTTKIEPHTQGLLDKAREHNIPSRVIRVPSQLDVHSQSWRKAQRVLKKMVTDWNPPVGMITSYDAGARVLITLMKDLGWTVPHELTVVGAGNEETICTATYPSLSSVDLGHKRNGYEAARLLAALMRGETPMGNPIVNPPKELIVRASSDVFSARDPEVQKALRFLSENSHLPIQVPDVTAATSVGRQTLERRFRAELDTSIYNELHRLRIERVKRLLVEQTDATIKEIGMNSGFSSLSNFFAAFKKLSGKTPEEYREEHADPNSW